MANSLTQCWGQYLFFTTYCCFTPRISKSEEISS